tara:strand:+ start:17373 stop:19802 length:2430 start_codon:yes stop_codon:yes gene_type:complete
MSKIALLPGGFKPPHAGHYNMAKWLSTNTKSTVLVRVGAKERDSITREMSLKLWELYTKNDSNIIVEPSVSNSPVKDVYDFVEKEAPEGSTVFLGMGKKDIDDKRFANMALFAEPRKIKFETILVPPQAGGVSGTQMREFIKNNDKESFQKYIPNHIDKAKAWSIVTGLEEDYYDPRNKTLDFMKSSEWKAGMPDGPKDDIPRHGDRIHNRQTSPVSWEESIKENKYYLSNSNIQGTGAFAQEDYPKGTIIDKLHDILGQNEYNFYELGKMYNHSDTPNCKNIMKDNTRYLITIQHIKQGEELTANYRLQPDLEQPNQFFTEIKQILNELSDREIRFFALHADILKQLNTPNFKSKYQELSQELEGERLEALEYFYNEYLSKLDNNCEIEETKYGGQYSLTQHKDKIQSDYGHQQYRNLQLMISQQKDEEVNNWLKTKNYIKENKVFSKDWWLNILTEGGAAGHMAHPFNLSNINSGQALKDIFRKAADSLNKTPGSVKIDGVNSSIRLVKLDGVKQFVMDRGSKKPLDIKGITKDDLLNRFGQGHGMVKVGGEVLDMFNEALPKIEGDLKRLGAWENPNILFNMEYVSGKTNVQEYSSNFIAIHGLNKIEDKEVQGKRGMLTKRISSEISYDDNALKSLLDNLKSIAKKRGYEVYGSVPTKMKKKPNFSSALSKRYTIEAGENTQTKSLDELLNELNNIPEEAFIFINVNGTTKKVGAVSKQVYLAILNGENIDDLFETAEDRQKAIEGFTTYLATEKLGDEVLKVLDSPMGSVENHEGVVIRDKNISNVPFKITGKFILGGLQTGFR